MKAQDRRHRIQKQVSKADQLHPRRKVRRAMQARTRKYPAPFPKQHRTKPGSERNLADKGTLITGRNSGIGCAVAILAREGADVAIIYPNEHADDEIIGSSTAMKRCAQPEEIAPAHAVLASPQCSSYITGEIQPIIGGYSGG